uniref:Uncharacterized protein n=1 Tax=Spironucleus salmonicida TaxID=348837 RepID=V6LU72_9EUKA|eukprot:EST47803.1 Hypothetical protein SS50377_12204 [Spironucleus salmonicida]
MNHYIKAADLLPIAAIKHNLQILLKNDDIYTKFLSTYSFHLVIMEQKVKSNLFQNTSNFSINENTYTTKFKPILSDIDCSFSYCEEAISQKNSTNTPTFEPTVLKINDFLNQNDFVIRNENSQSQPNQSPLARIFIK